MITLTAAARTRLQKQTKKAGKFGVYIAVIRSGCSGYSYSLDLCEAAKTGQLTFTEEGFTLIIDADSAPLLQGVSLDLKKQGLNESLVFNNPNATGTCGCGSSFSI